MAEATVQYLDDDPRFSNEQRTSIKSPFVMLEGPAQPSPDNPDGFVCMVRRIDKRTCCAYCGDRLTNGDLTVCSRHATEPDPCRTRDDDWRREQAMQAGMAGGCQAYNEVMGYDEGGEQQ